MTQAPRSIAITGAGGFIGSALVRRLLGNAEYASARICACDRHLPHWTSNSRIQLIEGDICDADVRDRLSAACPDVVFHFAGILGGAAEADYAISRRVNVDATLALFEALRDGGRNPRVVFASSIAVFGPPLPLHVEDDTTPHPTMTYGAQKLMMEIALEQFSNRGWIDGVALRLPGIVARPGADARIQSAFLNAVFYAYAAGQDFTLPVSPHSTSWLISIPTCIDAFVHAATVSTEAMGRRRTLTLPALRVSMSELLEALRAAYPQSRSVIRFAPNPFLEAQFGNYPRLTTDFADRLGFRHDGTIRALVTRAMLSEDTTTSMQSTGETL